MEYIQIPIPDLSFEAIIKNKVAVLVKAYVTTGNITLPYLQTSNLIKDEIKSVRWEFSDKKHRIYFVNELIIHVNSLKKKYDDSKVHLPNTNKFNQERQIEQHNEALMQFDLLLFFLYNLLKEDDVNVDSDSFTFEESFEIHNKLDAIIATLDTLKMGHEALGEEIQDVKDQISSLNNSAPLGKKSFYQRATGIAVHFASDKTIEVIWDALKPKFSDLLLNRAPALIEEILKLKF